MGTITINKTNGDILTTITDGAADTSTTSLAYIGRLYKNYGELVNENFVKLLENFANTTAPSAPMVGQLWYDTTNGILKVNRSTGFIGLARATTSAAEPSNALVGDFWYDTADNQLKMRSTSASWTVINPQFDTSQGKTGTFAETIVDQSNGNHVCIVHYQSGAVIAIECKDPNWTPNAAINGFTTIIPGYNLSTVNSQKFNGTATDSDKLGGINADMYALKTGGALSGALYLPNAGAFIGNAEDLHIYRESGLSKFKTVTGEFQFLTNTDTALAINQNEQTLHASGIVSVPSISFIEDVNSGFWSPAVGQVNLSIGGSTVLGVNAAGLTVTGNIAATGFTGTINSTTIVNSGSASVGQTLTAANVTVTNTLTAATMSVTGDATFGNSNTDRVTINADVVYVPNDLSIDQGDVIVMQDLRVNGTLTGTAGTDNVLIAPGLDVEGDLTVTGTINLTALDVASTLRAGTDGMLELDGGNRLKLNAASVASGYGNTGDFTLGNRNAIRSINTPKFWVSYGSSGTLFDSHNVAVVVKAATNNYAFSLFTSPAITSTGLCLVGSNNVRFQSAPGNGATSFAVFTSNESSLMGLAIYSA